MAEFNNAKKRSGLDYLDEEGSSGTGSGGQSGSIEFHDFLPAGTSKLSERETQQKLGDHEAKNKSSIEKGKETSDRYKEAREGKTATATYQLGGQAAGNESHFKDHPVLAGKFDGVVDPKVNPNPELNTNEKKEELTYQHHPELRNRNEPSAPPPRPTMY